MSISYNKLRKLLIDKGMNKKDLKKVSGVSTTSIAKLGKEEIRERLGAIGLDL